MLFNSYEFLFLFLPIALAGFAALRRLGRRAALVPWLCVCSFVFYGWWDLGDLALLGVSTTANYVAARIILRQPEGSNTRKILLGLAIASNLVVLGYFKYTAFLVANANGLFGTHLAMAEIALPLGISFFTFQQIIYLVDSERGRVVHHRFLDYVVFIAFFPHLIAGPIVHQGDVLPQFANRQFDRVGMTEFATATTVFCLGLFKKVVVADGVAHYVTPVFTAAAAGAEPSFLEAWCGAIAYTLQLYFDFSGYSDMALGLAAMFGITLPLNFYSPYKSGSIIEFWRRWHMTLSRFLRDYLYVPLGGNRRGRVRRYVNLMVVMLLGGLWHGASWTFVAWGVLHGIYICVNHAWRSMTEASSFGRIRGSIWAHLGGCALTFLAVTVAWVVFRAENWGAVKAMLRGMTGINGVLLPETYGALLGPAYAPLSGMNVAFVAPDRLRFFGGVSEILVLGVLLVAVWFLPNGMEWITGRRPAFVEVRSRKGTRLEIVPRWVPSPAWAAVVGLSLMASLLLASRPTEFLYFQF